jgi:hypothetical protein
MTRIPRSELLRETGDDLLEKHRVVWSRSRHQLGEERLAVVPVRLRILEDDHEFA